MTAQPLCTFPDTLAEAYALQRAVIGEWAEPVIGLKVGRITGVLAGTTGLDRFVGPIFASTLQADQPDQAGVFPLISGGSAALECELVAVLGDLVPALDSPLDRATLEASVAAWHVGIEIAGCPMAAVERFEAFGSIACFGNNTGLILGPSIPDWRDTDLDDIGCIARIDGEVVGQGSARRLPGGVWTALAFALAEARVRDLPLEPGMLISTGAVTGMHAMAEGWKAEADFGAFGTVACVGVAMPT